MLVEKYPEEISYQIELAITYLIIDRWEILPIL